MSDIDWSQYKPGDRIDLALSTGQEFLDEFIRFIGDHFVSIDVSNDGADGEWLDIPKDRIEWVRVHVPPLQPGDWYLSGNDQVGYTPYWIDDRGHLMFQLGGVVHRSVVLPKDVNPDLWRVRGGVQVKQP